MGAVSSDPSPVNVQWIVPFSSTFERLTRVLSAVPVRVPVVEHPVIKIDKGVWVTVVCAAAIAALKKRVPAKIAFIFPSHFGNCGERRKQSVYRPTRGTKAYPRALGRASEISSILLIRVCCSFRAPVESRKKMRRPLFEVAGKQNQDLRIFHAPPELRGFAALKQLLTLSLSRTPLKITQPTVPAQTTATASRIIAHSKPLQASSI